MPKKEKKLPKGSEAVASLCGLVLNRLQELEEGSIERDRTRVETRHLNQIFGEALQQFSVKVSEDE